MEAVPTYDPRHDCSQVRSWHVNVALQNYASLSCLLSCGFASHGQRCRSQRSLNQLSMLVQAFLGLFRRPAQCAHGLRKRISFFCGDRCHHLDTPRKDRQHLAAVLLFLEEKEAPTSKAFVSLIACATAALRSSHVFISVSTSVVCCDLHMIAVVICVRRYCF